MILNLCSLTKQERVNENKKRNKIKHNNEQRYSTANLTGGLAMIVPKLQDGGEKGLK